VHVVKRFPVDEADIDSENVKMFMLMLKIYDRYGVIDHIIYSWI